jgi:hypothetical protein
VRKEAQRLVPFQFRSADVEDRLDGAMPIHEREKIRRARVKRQDMQPSTVMASQGTANSDTLGRTARAATALVGP